MTANQTQAPQTPDVQTIEAARAYYMEAFSSCVGGKASASEWAPVQITAGELIRCLADFATRCREGRYLTHVESSATFKSLAASDSNA